MRAVLPFLLALALAGCIQVQLPTAPAGQAPAAAADADPSTHTVACHLRDENGTPLRDGACEYRFGSLGAKVPVDANGTAVRRVPDGAAGTLSGTAPGRAAAQASLTVTNDKVVRMTLPALPKAKPAPPPASNATAGAGPAANGTEEEAAFVNTTVYSGSVRDLVFDQTYAMLPEELPQATYTFNLPAGYQTLEFNGAYFPPGAYATTLDLTVRDPNGLVVLHYVEEPYTLPVVAYGQSLSAFPMGFWPAPVPGTYTVDVEGLGAPEFVLEVYGLAGLAPDFTFHTFPDGVQHHLNDYAGKVVIVDLMAAWCGPCNDAMPDLQAIYEEYAGLVEILSVDVTFDDSGGPDTPQSDTPQDLRDFIAKHGVTWPIGPDGEDYGTSASGQYGTGFIPTLVLVDQHGGLAYRHIGAIEPSELRARIDAALAR